MKIEIYQTVFILGNHLIDITLKNRNQDTYLVLKIRSPYLSMNEYRKKTYAKRMFIKQMSKQKKVKCQI